MGYWQSTKINPGCTRERVHVYCCVHQKCKKIGKKDMAMFKYLRPLEELQSLDGFNSSAVPSKTISKVSKQINDVVEQMCV